MRWRPRVPIRFKISFLILSSVSLSLSFYVLFGTSLIIRDKTSYIYEFQEAELKSAVDRMESRITECLRLSYFIGSSWNPSSKPIPNAAQWFSSQSASIGCGGVLVLKARDPDHFETLMEIGAQVAELKLALGQEGWTPAYYERNTILVGDPIATVLPVGAKFTSADGRTLASITSVDMAPAFPERTGKGAISFILDRQGKILYSDAPTIDPRNVLPLEASILANNVDLGARDWTDRNNDYIVSYRRFARGKLLALSIISKSLAFRAAHVLVLRSVFLGIAVFFLVVAFALIFIRSLTSRIREMWLATQRVSQGDYGLRVATATGTRDEMSDLAQSFNLMSGKIVELMEQTAQKARMEKELETAQAFQSEFFPVAPYRDAQVSLWGRYLPATECAGDWWHYAKVQDQLIIVLGDVTGHGVSAALLTAVVKGAFSQWIGPFQRGERANPSIAELVQNLNSLIRDSAGGKALMTFLALCIDSRQKTVSVINASHPISYLYRRPEARSEEASIFEYFVPMDEGFYPALGSVDDLKVESHVYALEDGDVIFGYTDGFFEPRLSDQTRLRSSKFLKLVRASIEASSGNVEAICDGAIQVSLDFFGSQAAMPDDITVIAAAVGDRPDGPFTGS